MGWPHPDYLLELLTAEQLGGWIDYSQREPFGFPIDDLRAAMKMSTIANAAGATPPMTVENFQLSDLLRDESNEEEDVLLKKLEKLFPPPPRVQETSESTE